MLHRIANVFILVRKKGGRRDERSSRKKKKKEVRDLSPGDVCVCVWFMLTICPTNVVQAKRSLGLLYFPGVTPSRITPMHTSSCLRWPWLLTRRQSSNSHQQWPHSTTETRNNERLMYSHDFKSCPMWMKVKWINGYMDEISIMEKNEEKTEPPEASYVIWG